MQPLHNTPIIPPFPAGWYWYGYGSGTRSRHYVVRAPIRTAFTQQGGQVNPVNDRLTTPYNMLRALSVDPRRGNPIAACNYVPRWGVYTLEINGPTWRHTPNCQACTRALNRRR